jgi:hypothetical protein
MSTSDHHQPCGCIKNRNGAHRDECPDWEAHIDGLDMWWTRREPSVAPSGHYEDADGEDANGYSIRCACSEEFNDPDNDHDLVRELLAKHVAAAS